jgi:hypothetical protein
MTSRRLHFIRVKEAFNPAQPATELTAISWPPDTKAATGDPLPNREVRRAAQQFHAFRQPEQRVNLDRGNCVLRHLVLVEEAGTD